MTNRLSYPLRKCALAAALCATLPAFAVGPAYELRIPAEGVRMSTAVPPPPGTVPATPPAIPAPAPAPRFVMATPAPSTIFGPTKVGTTAEGASTYLIRNTGDAPGSMPLLTPTGEHADDFSVTSSCTNVAAGAACNVSVAFRPQAAGTRSAVVTILGTTYPFQGQGTEPVGDGVSRTGACAAGTNACATFDRSRGYQQDKIGYSDDNLTIYRTQASAPQIYFTKVPTSGKSFIELRVTNGTYTSSFYCGSKKVGLTNGGAVTYQILLDYDTNSYAVYRGATKVGGFTGVTSMDCFVHLYSNVQANFGQYDFTMPVPAGYRPGIY